MKYLVVSLFVFCSSLGFTQTIRFSPENKLFGLSGLSSQLMTPYKPFLVGDDPNHWFFGFNAGKCIAYKKDTLTGNYNIINFPGINTNLVVLDVRDYNEDGKFEILTDRELYYLDNSGTTWIPSVINITSKKIKGYGDFNNDGRMDLIAESNNQYEFDALYLVLNEGANEYKIKQIEEATNELETMAVGDIDNNGYLDLAFTQSFGKPIKLLFNNGDSTFTKKEIASPSGLCCNTLSVELNDLDSDGDLDLLLAAKDDGIFIIKNQNGFANTNFVTQPEIKDRRNVINVRAHDFNKDGFMDIVFVNYFSDELLIQLMQAKADGTYYYPIVINVYDFTEDIKYEDGTAHKENLNFADINGDGYTDITYYYGEKKKCEVFYYIIPSSTDESPVLENKYFYPTVTYGPIFSVAPEGTTSVVLDIFGRKIMDIHPSQQSISLDHLGSGTYFIMTYQDGILKGRDRVMVVK